MNITITCPSCGRSFILKHKPGRIFTCPKCTFTTAFATVLAKEGVSPNPGPTMAPDTNPYGSVSGLPTDPGFGDKTKEIPGMGGDKTQVVAGMGGDKTKVVAGMGGSGRETLVVDGLQPRKYGFRLTYRGQAGGKVTLPPKNQFTLGRRSSDSEADVKLTPDLSMSRIHAGMRVISHSGGIKGYQITSAKDSNPVYVNGSPVARGKAVSLKPGDRIRMGETDLEFGRF